MQMSSRSNEYSWLRGCMQMSLGSNEESPRQHKPPGSTHTNHLSTTVMAPHSPPHKFAYSPCASPCMRAFAEICMDSFTSFAYTCNYEYSLEQELICIRPLIHGYSLDHGLICINLDPGFLCVQQVICTHWLTL